MKKPYIIKGIILVVLAAAVYCLQYFFDIASFFKPEQIKIWLADSGGFAPILYMLIMCMAVVISPIPSLPLDIAAGAFFGPVLGTLYSVAGALGGAVISFMIARFLGRDLVEKYIGGHVNFCVSCSDRILTRIVFLSRLLPVVSFDVISYGAGLTNMSLKKFSAATFLGMIPLTFLYNYSGSVFVFESGLSFVLGILMVVLFFVVPKWLEGKGFLKKMGHE
ncbi:MAG: TVP38/TMEM64 family protein [Nitrospirota bacterium]